MALNPYRGHGFPSFFGPGFDDFFGPTPLFLRDPFEELMPVLRNVDRVTDGVLMRSSPGYEIHEKDGSYQISVDLPGVKASDMKIELEDNGRLLHLSGGRKVQEGDRVVETKFDKKFTIGENVDTEKMTANLVDGVLTLQAPKKEITEPPKRTITITEGPHTSEHNGK